MAKKTTAVRRRTTRIDTAEDLRAWLVPQFPKGWTASIRVSFYDANGSHGRHSNSTFDLNVYCDDWGFSEHVQSGSAQELAFEFQSVIAPKIVAERERREKNQHLLRLGHEPNEQLVFTKRRSS